MTTRFCHVLALLPALLLALACGDTGQPRVEYPLFVSGVDPDSFTSDDGEWSVTLSEARLALGPVFFCASVIASAELCPSAQAEFAEVAEVDLLNPAPVRVGEVRGLSGVINSLVMDYNFTFFIAESLPSSDGDILDGHSAILRGTATRGADSLQFEAVVDVIPSVRGGFGVELNGPGADIVDDRARLDVSIDPEDWLGGVKFDELLPLAAPGAVVSIEAGTVNHNRILFAMTSNEAPSFEWSGEGVLP